MDKKLDPTVLLFCGPPASGKDTVTNILAKINSQFLHFCKHRGIDGHIPDNHTSTRYIDITKSEFETMIAQDEFIQYHQRYDRYYGISKKLLKDCVNSGQIPVIHVGRISNLFELEKRISYHILKVLLWCPLTILETRLKNRHSNDPEEVEIRLAAAMQEFQDLLHTEFRKIFDIIIENNTSANVSANLIYKAVADGTFLSNGGQRLESYLSEFIH